MLNWLTLSYGTVICILIRMGTKTGHPTFYTSTTCFTIKTHDSESRGQEETAIIRETKNTRPLSELFTRKSVHKTTNAVVKPP